MKNAHQKLKIIVPFDTNQPALGSLDAENNEQSAMAHELLNAIEAKRNDFTDDILARIKDRVGSELYEDAIELAELAVGEFIPLERGRELLEILSFDYAQLCDALQIRYLIFFATYNGVLGQFKLAEKYIKQLEGNFGNELNNEVLSSFVLTKACSAQEQDYKALAVTLFQKVVTEEQFNAVDKAIAYEHLASLAVSEQDTLEYFRLASDLYLVSGKPNLAITTLEKMCEILVKIAPEKALACINSAIELCKSEKSSQGTRKACLLHSKATYYLHTALYPDALDCIDEAISLTEMVIGAEVQFHGHLTLAYEISTKAKEKVRSNEYKQKITQIRAKIEDPEFNLILRVEEYFEHSPELSDDLWREVWDSGNESLIALVLTQESINNSITTEQALLLLEKAKAKVNNIPHLNVYDVIECQFGCLFKAKGMDKEACASFEAALKHNPYLDEALRELISIYKKACFWEKLEALLKRQMELRGKLPSLCFDYADALYRQSKFAEVIVFSGKVDEQSKELKNLISLAIRQVTEPVIKEIQPAGFQCSITKDDVYQALKEFSLVTSKKLRMSFWSFDKARAGYKWISCPESLGKCLLISFLSAKFGDSKVNIIEESRAGAGFIDLLLIIGPSLRIVIELKMCGVGYSKRRAASGLEQIVHYQNNTDAYLGFLVVFDARTRDFQKGFERVQTVDNKTIYSVVADVRPVVA